MRHLQSIGHESKRGQERRDSQEKKGGGSAEELQSDAGYCQDVSLSAHEHRRQALQTPASEVTVSPLCTGKAGKNTLVSSPCLLQEMKLVLQPIAGTEREAHAFELVVQVNEQHAFNQSDWIANATWRGSGRPAFEITGQ